MRKARRDTSHLFEPSPALPHKCVVPDLGRQKHIQQSTYRLLVLLFLASLLLLYFQVQLTHTVQSLFSGVIATILLLLTQKR